MSANISGIHDLSELIAGRISGASEKQAALLEPGFSRVDFLQVSMGALQVLTWDLMAIDGF